MSRLHSILVILCNFERALQLTLIAINLINKYKMVQIHSYSLRKAFMQVFFI